MGRQDQVRGAIVPDATKAASEVQGLDVRPNGELVVTGDYNKVIADDLCSALEKAMRGHLVVDVEVRLNLTRGSGA